MPPLHHCIPQIMKREHKKMWEEEREQPLHPDAGVDELLAVLGYKVRPSDMEDVAQKIEQMEMAMKQGSSPENSGLDSDSGYGSGSGSGFGLISHLSSETVHSNPSDLSTYYQSILSEINPNQNPAALSGDLTAIPGGAICAPEPKRLKLESNPKPSSLSESIRPIVLIDSQQNGIRLVHTLLACAEAIHQQNFHFAESLVSQIGLLAVSQPGAMRKVATYFAEALARRIYRLYPQESFDSTSITELLESHFYETCPYLKFAHFTANQAILEAFQGFDHVHVIDFSMKQGLQWPVLIQALALRPGGPPTFRLTAIGPPQADQNDSLQQVGMRLAKLAESVNVEFEYRGFVASSLADIDAGMLNLRSGEAVAVNSVFDLHRLLARPGAMEKVLKMIKKLNPQIFTVVEQEASHNGLGFLDRFTESLSYYATLFDSLEGCSSGCTREDQMMSEVYLGKQIYNVVACEGVERVERHETLSQWRVRLGSAGFVPVCLGSNAFKQASTLLSLFGGVDGYSVEENGGCLMLGWHNRPLIATSTWRLGLRGM